MENKFKVGDKVLLKNRRGDCWNPYGEMDKYMGTIVTISKIYGDLFEIEEDHNRVNNKWSFNFEDIERLANDITLSDLQFADILTLRNGERYVYASKRMYGEDNSYYCDCDLIENYYNDDLTNGDRNKEQDIVKVERAGKIIYERKEEAKEMTLQEICKELGYEVKIVKGEK